MTNAETNTSRHRCGTGRARRAGEGPLEERRHPEEGRAQGPENRQGSAKQGRQSPRRAKQAATPRAESKGAKILALIRRPKGATLAELAKLTGWQNHSIRGFLSGAVGKKMGLTVESAKREDGERVYSISK